MRHNTLPNPSSATGIELQKWTNFSTPEITPKNTRFPWRPNSSETSIISSRKTSIVTTGCKSSKSYANWHKNRDIPWWAEWRTSWKAASSSHEWSARKNPTEWCLLKMTLEKRKWWWGSATSTWGWLPSWMSNGLTDATNSNKFMTFVHPLKIPIKQSHSEILLKRIESYSLKDLFAQMTARNTSESKFWQIKWELFEKRKRQKWIAWLSLGLSCTKRTLFWPKDTQTLPTNNRQLRW